MQFPNFKNIYALLLYFTAVYPCFSDTQSVTNLNQGCFVKFTKIVNQTNQNAHFIQLVIHLDFGNETNINHSRIVPVPASFWGKGGKEVVGTNAYDAKPNDWKYFMATNSFCGPIELADKSGNKLPLLRPAINALEVYPRSYNLGLIRRQVGARRLWERPYALIPDDNMEAEMLEFKLEDYFKVEVSDEYQLTVWPKIYQRPDIGNDSCTRIDLAPVMLSFHLEGSGK